MDSVAVEAYLERNREVVFNGEDALDCNIRMDEMCRDGFRLDIDSCEFDVRVIEEGLPTQCRRPIRKVASDMVRLVDNRCR